MINYRLPPITSAQVQKYLPPSRATAKGHINQTRKRLRSMTKEKTQTETEKAEDFNPQQDEAAEVELFIGATITDQNDGTIYTN